MSPLLIAAGVALLLGVVNRKGRGVVPPRLDALLAHRALPVVLGLVTCVLVWSVWGSLSAPGAYHDERAYLVQARLLAGFTWTAPTPPVPMAWEMAHMFMEPAIFAKYPPGHAPLLVPGIWLGMQALVPVLIAGLCGALLFLLVRRVTDGWSALLAWLIWTTSPSALTWHASYFSETTTTALWLGALLALVAWRQRERAWLLVALTAAIAWIGITRPVTGIALALPIAVVVLRTAWTRRSMRGFTQAATVGLLICAIIPYWNWRTTGSFSELPYSSYSKYYFPFDLPGFTRDDSAPLRQLPADLEALSVDTRDKYREHVPARIPANFAARSAELVRSSLGPWATSLMLFIPLGMIVLGVGTSLVLGASFAFMVAAYLVMPHVPDWTIYYLEVFPVAPTLVAVGMVASLRWLRRRAEQGGRLELPIPGPPHLVAGALVMLAIALPPVLTRLEISRMRQSARQLVAEGLIAELEDPRAVVFVRRDPRLSPHFTVHDIRGVPATTPTWIVRDLGDSLNAVLLSHAGGRRPYLFDELKMTLVPLGAASDSTGSRRNGSE